MQLPVSIREILPQRFQAAAAQYCRQGGLEEVRLTAGQPLLLLGSQGEKLYPELSATRRDMEKIMLLLTKGSIYAYERELAAGFLTLEGGHRVGFCGTALGDGTSIRSQKEISSINIRLARGIIGAADTLLQRLHPFFAWGEESLLILSPPGAGKTTLLRDLILALSEGRKPLRQGYRIGVVDERSELAAMHAGSALHKLGPRSFVIDAAPKAQGLQLLLRSMSPQILATDELGSSEEWRCLVELSRSGVSTLFTVHGCSLDDVQQRPEFRDAVEKARLHTVVELSRWPQPGSIAAVWRWQKGRWNRGGGQDCGRRPHSAGRLGCGRAEEAGVDAAPPDSGGAAALHRVSAGRAALS